MKPAVDWLQPTKALAGSTEPLVAVGLAVTDETAKQFHVGLIHKSAEADAKILHLAWHHSLCNDALPHEQHEFFWARVDLPAERAEALAALCRRIMRRNAQEIGYGLLYKGGRFAPDGMVLLEGSEVGLTCATFVLAALKGGGIELLKLSSWPPRSEDRQWQRSIIALLRSCREKDPKRVSAQHIASVEEEEGCVRYRPEEVTGACSEDAFPVEFAAASAAGKLARRRVLPRLSTM